MAGTQQDDHDSIEITGSRKQGGGRLQEFLGNINTNLYYPAIKQKIQTYNKHNFLSHTKFTNVKHFFLFLQDILVL